MDTAFEDVAGQFARRIIQKDYESARELLAPWLRDTVTAAQLESMVHEHCKDLPAPAEFEVDSNSCGLEDLTVDANSPPTRSLPPEITPQNYRQWMVIQLKPAADDDSGYDACFDLWIALVEVDGAPKIGYLEAAQTE
jgi:hypothetical protein